MDSTFPKYQQYIKKLNNNENRIKKSTILLFCAYASFTIGIIFGILFYMYAYSKPFADERKKDRQKAKNNGNNESFKGDASLYQHKMYCKTTENPFFIICVTFLAIGFLLFLAFIYFGNSS